MRIKLCATLIGLMLAPAMGWALPYSSPQKRVLLLYDSRSDMLGNIIVDRVIRSVLNEAFSLNLDVRSEYFEVSGDQDFLALQDWLKHKYARLPVDVVVAIGSNALSFVNSYRHDLFPAAQIVFWGRKDGLKNWTSTVPVTGVVAPDMARNFRATVDFIFKLQPDLRQLIVVSGAAPVDLRWETAARTALPEYENRIEVSWLASVTLEDLQARLQSLPSHTAVVFLTVTEDGVGRRLSKSEVLHQAVQLSSAPVYSTSSAFVETGIVGGALVSQEVLSSDTAHVVARLLRGGRTEDIPIHEGAITPTANWRELRRWGIPENRLPAGTIVVHKDPTFWELYRWPIIVVLSLCLFEALLIAALLIQSASRKRAEKSLMESRRLLQSTIDALHAQIVLLDGNGTVTAVNQSWLRFGNPKTIANGTCSDVGRDYLEVCESGIRLEEAQHISRAIQDLISGTRNDFTCIYECPQAPEPAWFQLRMNRFYSDGTPWVVMEHENVTELKRAHDAHQQLTGQLLRAQDEERRRIARDLHDVTVQNTATLKADLTRVHAAAHLLDERSRDRLKDSLVVCDQVIKELRTLSYLLHPPLLDELGLVPALQWYVRGFTERSGIQVEVRIHEDIGRLSTDAETTLFRVAQEALSNIHRHSGSSTAIIIAKRQDDTFFLQIKDRGRGIQSSSGPHLPIATPPGVGILGMGERLRQLGGQLDIESSDQGTTITARVPTTTAVLCYVS